MSDSSTPPPPSSGPSCDTSHQGVDDSKRTGQNSGPSPDETALPVVEGGSVARATGVLGFVTLISRILGLLRDVTLASYFGAGLVSDAFLVAFRIPNLLRRIVAEGALASAFVPIFSEDLKRAPREANRTLAAATGLALLITVPITALGIYFAPEIIEFISPGFGHKTEKSELATSLLIVMFPYAIFITLIALASSALNSLGAFGLAAATSVILNIAMIISIAALGRFFVRPIFAPAAAVVFAGFVGFYLLWHDLRRRNMPMRVIWPWRSPRTKALLVIFIPTLLSASLYQIIVFLNSLIASLLDEGSISWLYYADRIFQFPLGVFTLALSTAALPRLSALAAEERELSPRPQPDKPKEQSQIGKEIAVYLSWVTFLTLPAAFSLIVFAIPITSLMYERGSFDHSHVLQTASALSCYAVGLWTLSCHSLLVRAFLAKQNTWIPSLIAVLSIFTNLLLAIVFMGRPTSLPETQLALLIHNLQYSIGIFSFGHAGIALAGSVASFVSFYGLLAMLPKVGFEVYFEDVMPSIIRAFLASVPMIAGLKALLAIDLPVPVTVIIGVPFGALTYLGAAHLLGMPHTKSALEFAQNQYLKMMR